MSNVQHAILVMEILVGATIFAIFLHADIVATGFGYWQDVHWNCMFPTPGHGPVHATLLHDRIQETTRIWKNRLLKPESIIDY